MAWKDTYTELFAEADAAKEQAKAEFLAALDPPNPAVLPLDRVIPLVDAITTAQWQALLKHIGPVSGDNSIEIGMLSDADLVQQLDLRAKRLYAGGPLAAYEFWRGASYGLKDTTGHGYHLSVQTGSESYADLATTGQGAAFDGTTWYKGSASALRLVGDCSAFITVQLDALPASGKWAVLFGALPEGFTVEQDEDELSNCIYKMQVDHDGRLMYIHEHDAGVNVSVNTASGTIATGVTYEVGFVRSGRRTVVYVNGVQAAEIADGDPPSGGDPAYLSVGYHYIAPDSTLIFEKLQGKVIGLVVYDVALLPNDVAVLSALASLRRGMRSTGTSIVTATSIVAPDSNTRARFLFDEAVGSTTFVNSGNVAGDLTVSTGTVYPGRAGQYSRKGCLWVPANTRVKSGTAKWEYASALTVSCWVWLTAYYGSGGATGRLVTKATEVNAWSTPFYAWTWFFSSGALSFNILGVVSPRTVIGCNHSMVLIPLNTWVHLAATYDTNYTRMYLNGVQLATSANQSGTTIKYGNQGEHWIGEVPGETAAQADFAIQDLRIEDVVRTATELQNAYERGAGLFPNVVVPS